MTIDANGNWYTSDTPYPILGFVSDYYNVPGCPACGSRDDDVDLPSVFDGSGHGTQMSGLVGATENGIGVVGIMPAGETVTMKITVNSNNVGSCCADYFIPDGAFVRAVDYAMSQSYDVLSMSFVGDFGPSVEMSLQNAAYSDVLLLAGTGNEPWQAGMEPASLQEVMGVGGLTFNDNNIWQDLNEDISALAGGMTIVGVCPLASSGYCNGVTTGESGGTSAATANAAAIAGLVRAYNPTMQSFDVWNRLWNTADVISHSDGTTSRKLNALRAVRGF